MAETPSTSRPQPGEGRTDPLVDRLTTGLRLATVLVVLGLEAAFAWSALSGAYPALEVVRAPWQLPFGPTALTLGAALLLAFLPPLRVILAGIAFARSRDLRYVAFSAVALALIVLSNLLGLFLRKG